MYINDKVHEAGCIVRSAQSMIPMGLEERSGAVGSILLEILQKSAPK